MLISMVPFASADELTGADAPAVEGGAPAEGETTTAPTEAVTPPTQTIVPPTETVVLPTPTVSTVPMLAARVEGMVTVMLNGAPASTATVTLAETGATGTTNIQGMVTFSDLEPGDYTANVQYSDNGSSLSGSATLTVYDPQQAGEGATSGVTVALTAIHEVNVKLKLAGLNAVAFPNLFQLAVTGELTGPQSTMTQREAWLPRDLSHLCWTYQDILFDEDTFTITGKELTIDGITYQLVVVDGGGLDIIQPEGESIIFTAPSGDDNCTSYDLILTLVPVTSTQASFFIRTGGGFVPMEDGTTFYSSGEYAPHPGDGQHALKGFVRNTATWTDCYGEIVDAKINGQHLLEAFQQVSESILLAPTTQEIQQHVDASYNPKTHDIYWYVIKNQGTCGDDWHVDGIIYPKGVKYILQYAGNAGTDDVRIPGSNLYVPNAAAPLDFTASRSGYRFLGWSEDPQATAPTYTAADTDRTITMTRDIILYAIWERDAVVTPSQSVSPSLTPDLSPSLSPSPTLDPTPDQSPGLSPDPSQSLAPDASPAPGGGEDTDRPAPAPPVPSPAPVEDGGNKFEAPDLDTDIADNETPLATDEEIFDQLPPLAALPELIEEEFLIVDEASPLGSLPQTGTTRQGSGSAFGMLFGGLLSLLGAGALSSRKQRGEH